MPYPVLRCSANFSLMIAVVLFSASFRAAADDRAASGVAAEAVAASQKSLFTAWQETSLPNAIQVTGDVISGGQPAGEAGFAALQRRGVKTIISVDGMRPDVETAGRFGLQYVHLPHGYDGISTDTTQALAKAVDTLPSPIYIHCHHGRHRSPAAAAVACIAAGRLPRSQGLKLLQAARTGAEYGGLFRAVKAAAPLHRARLDELHVKFTAAASIPPLVDEMVEMQHALDRLTRAAATQSAAAAAESTGEPAAARLVDYENAVLLLEHLKEFGRSESTTQRPEPWRQITAAAIARAEQLALLLQPKQKRRSADALSRQRRQLLQQIRSDCRRCHLQFRN